MYRSVLFFLAVITAIAAGPSWASEKVEINQWYLPETSYSIKQSSTNLMTMTLENPFAVPETVRQNFPVSMVVDDNREISIVTGKMTKDKKFPITFELKKAVQLLKQNDQTRNIGDDVGRLVGVRTHGTTDLQGNLSLVKLDGKELPEEEQKIVIATFEAVSKAMKSAQVEPIGIGEKFTKTVPLEIPVPGLMNIGMEVTTTYQLVGVKDGVADFATTYTFKLSASAASEQNLKIEASGKGTGKIIYDVKKRVQLKALNTLELAMTLPLDPATIHVLMKTEDSSVTEVR
ncbi:hypothetical protein GMLC_23540 [Geomonas limicola]|uniref:Uncharacterized protein n=1 Tax=Geomonas limicola TaxID=2740186 RepID=A0A6V8N874_9BACT|nr:hypothetical protein [Geomonas limicola]GFO68775.1 hypothetical protein GMLC_23540 [Geomonas limicola]